MNANGTKENDSFGRRLGLGFLGAAMQNLTWKVVVSLLRLSMPNSSDLTILVALVITWLVITGGVYWSQGLVKDKQTSHSLRIGLLVAAGIQFLIGACIMPILLIFT